MSTLEIPIETLAMADGLTVSQYQARIEADKLLLAYPPSRSSKEIPEYFAMKEALAVYFEQGGGIETYDYAETLKTAWRRTPEYRYEALKAAQGQPSEVERFAAVLASKIEGERNHKVQIQSERRDLARSLKTEPKPELTPAQLAKQGANRRAYAARKSAK